MTFGWGRTVVLALGAILMYLAGSVPARGQAGPTEKPQMAEEAFKNIQVLRGISVSEFMDTMGFFAASLDANCTTCHDLVSGDSWDKYATDDIPAKQIARRMIVMMRTINQQFFAGQQGLTCYSCHRFGKKPKIVPSLVLQYGGAPDEDPDEIVAQVPGQPTPDQVLDKFYRAVGGAAKLASMTSIVAKGTRQGYDDTEQHPFELYAKAPNQRTTILDSYGLTTNTYDGRNGWVAAPYTDVPVTLVTLDKSDLDGARVDAELTFPARIKQTLTDLRVGPPFTINDRDVTILQGYSPLKSPVKLYFDNETGLLIRMVRYTTSVLGRQPTQIDYSDYREVNGLKMPFYWITTWTDGRWKTQWTDMKVNIPVDASQFAKPAAPPKK